MTDSTIQLDDVQGMILRGYRVDLARHFVLEIGEVEAARKFIAGIVDGANGLPRITTLERTHPKPSCFVNIGFTYSGLAALGLSETYLQKFDPAFQRGACSAVTANLIGDIGASSPANWISGMKDGSRVHVLLSLWVKSDPAVMESVTADLRAAFVGGMTELTVQDANALPDSKVHFGYRDSIAQPTVLGAPPGKTCDDQPVVATGEFLLGYLNAGNGTYSVEPSPLSKNSSYAAFRILEQDVDGFETLLNTYSGQVGMDPEMLAAKICGRWRNGNPLVLSPTEPGAPLPPEQLNNFQYTSQDASQDDTVGLKCPIGSHIRRNNPRNELVNGNNVPQHRIIRRAMPYGPAYDPSKPTNEPRGLIGYFINASITNQFEFLLSQWNNTSQFVQSATGPGGPNQGNAHFNISGQDVFLGINDPGESSFTVPGPGPNGRGNQHITGFSRLITTRGGAYCFFPSITGLRYLAALS